VIIYDVYGSKARSIPDLPKDKTLRLLVEELSHQEKEARKLQLVIWLEKWASNPPADQYRFGLDYIGTNLAGRDFYYHYQGKPLVLTYHNGPNPAIDEIERKNPSFAFRRVGSGYWPYLEAYPQTLNRQWMPASPGFDGYMETAFIAKYVNKAKIDLDAIRKHGVQQREDGRFFERQLLRAREANPEIIFLCGWNDWEYSAPIEPAVEYGFKYVDMAARLLGRETETLPYRQSQ
jgi:hypothetical protein